MKKIAVILCAALIVSSPLTVKAQGTPSYVFYLEQGQKALDEKKYDEALHYFKQAYLVNPSAQAPIDYLNYIKRVKDQRVKTIVPYTDKNSYDSNLESRPQVVSEPIVEIKKPVPEEPSQERAVSALPASSIKLETQDLPNESYPPSKAVAPKEDKKIVITRQESPLAQGPKTVYLDGALWQTQPRTFIQIQLKSYVILEGKNIERFLVITPDIIEAERIDRDHIKLTALKRGITYLHIWDATGRWTFNVEVIYQLESKIDIDIKEESVREQKARPFRLAYSADWGAFYRGPSLDEQERQSLNFLQWSGQYGETPYGDYDSYVVVNKFVESQEVTGYSVGLSNGHIGPFKDFTIRGFDNTKMFSPLTVPGQYFRGVLFESEAFHHKFKYTYFQGQDRAIFGYLAPNVLDERRSYVEGLKMTLNPREEDQFSVNYAHGYGSARDEFLKKRVFSIQGQKRVSNVLLNAEQAYDEDTLASTVGSSFDRDDLHVRVSARDIDKDFTTITNFPSNRGEVGGIINATNKIGEADFDISADVYRDRALPNEETPNAINLDLSTSLDVPLGERTDWRASAYWLDTPGELSPRRNLRLNNTLSRRFPLGNFRELSAFIGSTYQMSRFNFNPTSEYDRYSLSAGFGLPLSKRFNYFANYEFSWVDELYNGESSTPSVLNTGISYLNNISKSWTLTAGLTYRDEQDTEGLNSFLAGEDSTIGNIGLTYRPSADFEFFIDGRLRNVWAESSRASAFNEIDIRSGVRTAWDTMFSWSPTGTIDGYVYKDLNNNKRRDSNEEGIGKVKVNVGSKSAVTNKDGYYKTKINAKKVQISLDISTIPQGFVFSTPAIIEKNIVQHKSDHADFGLSTNSGIYGVVYEDKNGDHKPGQGDKLISRVKITLDGAETVLTDSEGNYFFQNLTPGDHTLMIDINSLPEGYLPELKMKNSVSVAEGTTYIFHVPVTKK